eukprot:4345051-Amphidinium_carterae.1
MSRDVSGTCAGLAEMPRCTIYFVPPEEDFLTALGLAASQQMMCIQVCVLVSVGISTFRVQSCIIEVPTVDEREAVTSTAEHALPQDGEVTKFGV